MFADLALARRIERAEAALTTSVVGAVDAADAFVTPVGEGVAAFARPGSPMNKVIGIGLDGPPDPAELAAIEAAYAARGEPVRVELASLAPIETIAALHDRGYALRGFEHVLGRAAAPTGAPPAAIAIEEVTAATLDTWLEVDLDATAGPDGTGAPVDDPTREVIREALADFVRAPGFGRWLARIDGAPAGAATARTDGGILQLCGSATLPSFRRRGVQRALLDARLASPHELAVVTTAPGSQSQANVTRRGFALLYLRAILEGPTPPAG